jgi:TonB family protein
MPQTLSIILLASLALPALAADPAGLLNSAREARRQGDTAGAKSAYDAALELAQSQPDRRLASVAVEVSTFYTQQNNLARAEEVVKNAAVAVENAHVAPINEASLYIVLAEMYSRQQRVADLEGAQTRLVKIWEESIGPDAVVVANALYRLSTTQERTNDFAGAEESMKRALATLEKTYGPDAPTTGYALGRMATIEKRLDKTDEAASAAARAAALRPKETGPVERVGGSVTAPRVLSKQDPHYSDEARKARIQGAITISLVVDESGNPQHIAVLLPLGAGLDEAAAQSVGKWHFQPAAKNGVPVAVQATVEINFRLL